MARNSRAWRGSSTSARKRSTASGTASRERRKARSRRAGRARARTRPRRRPHRWRRGWRGRRATRWPSPRPRARALRALAPIHDARPPFPRERVRGVRLGESVETQARPAVSEDVTVHSRHAPRRHRDPRLGTRPSGRDARPLERPSAERGTPFKRGPPRIGLGIDAPVARTPKRNPDRRARDDSLATGDAFTRESNRRPTLCLAARCCGPRARRGSA